MVNFKRIASKSKASQGENELEWLLRNVAAIKPQVVVEIGVHLGHSLKAWRDAFKPKLLIGIQDEINQELYDRADNIGASLIKGDSHEKTTQLTLKAMLRGEQVDFLFIDGDHTYEGVKSDYIMYSNFVRKGGIIAFHDAAITDHPLVDVYKFLEKLVQEDINITIYQSDANGVGILHV